MVSVKEQHLTKYNAALLLINKLNWNYRHYQHHNIKTRINWFLDAVCKMSYIAKEGMLCEKERNKFIGKVFKLMINPKYICNVLKAQFIRSVLAIKHKGVCLYNMLLDKTSDLWWYSFDDTKLLYFTRRYIDYHPHMTIKLKMFDTFNKMMKQVSPYFYQIAPDTETGNFFTNVRRSCKKYDRGEYTADGLIKMEGDTHYYYTNKFDISFNTKDLTARKIKNRIKDKHKNTMDELVSFYNNFYYIKPNNLAGTHFNFNFDLKKNVLVWDASNEQYKHQRIYNFFDLVRKQYPPSKKPKDMFLLKLYQPKKEQNDFDWINRKWKADYNEVEFIPGDYIEVELTLGDYNGNSDIEEF